MTEYEAREALRDRGIVRGMEEDRSCAEIMADLAALAYEEARYDRIKAEEANKAVTVSEGGRYFFVKNALLT